MKHHTTPNRDAAWQATGSPQPALCGATYTGTDDTEECAACAAASATGTRIRERREAAGVDIKAVAMISGLVYHWLIEVEQGSVPVTKQLDAQLRAAVDVAAATDPERLTALLAFIAESGAYPTDSPLLVDLQKQAKAIANRQ